MAGENPADTEGSISVHCTRCGQVVGDEYVVCPSCGTSLGDAGGRMAQPPAFQPSHLVPTTGLAVWSTPNPAIDPVFHLGPGTGVRVVARNGAWGEVRDAEGRTGWLDARVLAAVGTPEATGIASRVAAGAGASATAGVYGGAYGAQAAPAPTGGPVPVSGPVPTSAPPAAARSTAGPWVGRIDRPDQERQVRQLGREARWAVARAFGVVGALVVFGSTFADWTGGYATPTTSWHLPATSLFHVVGAQGGLAVMSLKLGLVVTVIAVLTLLVAFFAKGRLAPFLAMLVMVLPAVLFSIYVDPSLVSLGGYLSGAPAPVSAISGIHLIGPGVYICGGGGVAMGIATILFGIRHGSYRVP